MKYTYIALTLEENDKYFSSVLRVHPHQNLLNFVVRPNIIVAHLCESKKQCIKLVTLWNENYKANGTYLLDEFPSF